MPFPRGKLNDETRLRIAKLNRNVADKNVTVSEDTVEALAAILGVRL
jgi:hypothetical protein